MEKRLARPLNLATVAQYTPVLSSMKKLAGECTAETAKGKAAGFNFQADNANFNMATFINCCLDRMGVGEVDKSDSLPVNAVKLDEMLDLKPNEFDPVKKKQHADLERKRVKELNVYKKTGAWKEEVDLIATSDNAIRELIKSRSRIAAITIVYMERFLIGGELNPKEKIQVKNISGAIRKFAAYCKLDCSKTDSDVFHFVFWQIYEASLGNLSQEALERGFKEKIALRKDKHAGDLILAGEKVRLVRRTTPDGHHYFLVNSHHKTLTADKAVGRNKYSVNIPLVPGLLYTISHDQIEKFKYTALSARGKHHILSNIDEDKTDYPSSYSYPYATLQLNPDGTIELETLTENASLTSATLWNRSDFDFRGFPQCGDDATSLARPIQANLLPPDWKTGYHEPTRVHSDLTHNPYATIENHDMDPDSPDNLEIHCNPRFKNPQLTMVTIAEGKGLPGNDDTSLASFVSANETDDSFDQFLVEYTKMAKSRSQAIQWALIASVQKGVAEGYEHRKSAMKVTTKKYPQRVLEANFAKSSLGAAVLDKDGSYYVAKVGSSPKVFKLDRDKITELTPSVPKTTSSLIGDSPTMKVDVMIGKLAPGEQLLVCSQGVWEKVSPQILHFYARKSKHAIEAVEAIYALAKRNGAERNITLALLQQKII